MVHHEQQDVLLLAGAQEVHAQRRLVVQREPAGSALGHCRRGQVGDLHGHGRRVDQHGHGLPVAVLDERAQRLVPIREIDDGGAQRVDVERPFETPGGRDAVGGIRSVQTVVRPHPALCGRQDVLVGADHLGPLGDGAGLQEGRQTGDRRRVEHRAHRQLHAGLPAHQPDQPHGEQGVPAEREEVVVGADAVAAQHLGGEPREQPLGGGLGIPARRGDGGGGQRAAIELAARGQRQRVQHHHRGRDERGGQRLPQVTDVRIGADDVADERVAVHCRSGVLDTRQRGERGLDLAQLDAVAADLDLVVGAAQVLQRTVGTAAHDVAGAVHPLARRGVGDEAARR